MSASVPRIQQSIPRFHSSLYFRGVAKVVSRQFRVLETVGSSPAASTKKTVFDGLFLFCRSRQGREPTSRIFTMLALGSLLIFVRILPARELGSHSKRSRGELAHQRRVIGIFTFGENPALVFPYSLSEAT